MLIKLDSDAYINAESIACLIPLGKQYYHVYFIGNPAPHKITVAAALYLVNALGVDEGFLGSNAPQPEPLSLRSRLANFLRDSPEKTPLYILFSVHANDSTDDVKKALAELLAEGVILCEPALGDDITDSLYWHKTAGFNKAAPTSIEEW